MIIYFIIEDLLHHYLQKKFHTLENLETETDSEKELVQYYDNWTIFRYMDNETNCPMFDVKYMDKTVEELEEEGYSLLYRIYYKDEISHSFRYDIWHDIIYISESIDSITENDGFYIQFQVLDNNNFYLPVSKSYTISIWPQKQPFPYILSSNIDYCEYYYFKTTSNNYNYLTVNLTYSEHLTATDVISQEKYCSIEDEFLTDPFLVENLSFNNYTNNVQIDETSYSIQNCTVSFNLQLSKSCYKDNSSIFFIEYAVGFLGLNGAFSNQKPSEFLLSVCTPQYTYADSITISSTSNTVNPGNTLSLTANISPKDATDKTVTWTSSNEKYATVNANGVVTAMPAGIGKTVTITAISNSNKSVIGTYVITISPPVIPVTKINISSKASSVAAGKKITLKTTVAPENATNKTVTWTSSNEKYATVNANGVVTTKAKGAGKTVTITAKANDGSNKQASFKLKIKKVSVKKIKLSGKKTVKAGKKITLKATVTPSNATNKSVKWSTSSKKYATVSSKGVVKAKKAGKGKTVKITATAKDGSKKKATIKIKIK